VSLGKYFARASVLKFVSDFLCPEDGVRKLLIYLNGPSLWSVVFSLFRVMRVASLWVWNRQCTFPAEHARTQSHTKLHSCFIVIMLFSFTVYFTCNYFHKVCSFLLWDFFVHILRLPANKSFSPLHSQSTFCPLDQPCLLAISVSLFTSRHGVLSKNILILKQVTTVLASPGRFLLFNFIKGS
jgi:hypothetical protein